MMAVVVAVLQAVIDVDASRHGSAAGMVGGLCGRVVDAAAGTNGVRAGDLVAGFGLLADRAVCRPGTLFVVAGDGLQVPVTDRGAALLPLAALALHIADQLAPLDGAVVVNGLSAIGLLTALVMRRAAAGPVSGIDERETRRRLGAAAGMARVWPTPPPDEEWSRAVDTTGHPDAVVGLLQAMTSMGRVALVGASRGRTASVDFYSTVHRRGLVVIGIPAPQDVMVPGHEEAVRRATALAAEAWAWPGFVSKRAVAPADVERWGGEEPLLHVRFE